MLHLGTRNLGSKFARYVACEKSCRELYRGTGIEIHEMLENLAYYQVLVGNKKKPCEENKCSVEFSKHGLVKFHFIFPHGTKCTAEVPLNFSPPLPNLVVMDASSLIYWVVLSFHVLLYSLICDWIVLFSQSWFSYVIIA